MNKEKIKKLHETIMSVFFRTMCVVCLMCSWGFFFAYIMGGISFKLFIGFSLISAGVAYGMIDKIMHENYDSGE